MARQVIGRFFIEEMAEPSRKCLLGIVGTEKCLSIYYDGEMYCRDYPTDPHGVRWDHDLGKLYLTKEHVFAAASLLESYVK